jgi:hypothetical protein
MTKGQKVGSAVVDQGTSLEVEVEADDLVVNGSGA